MAFDGSSGSCWTPDVPVGWDHEWRLRIAQFGDGYAQRTLDGINALNMKWQVTFETRPMGVITSMLSFLANQKGNSFQFKEPMTGTLYDVWCDSWHVDLVIRRWNRTNPAAPLPIYYGTLSAEFIKANGVTA